MGAKTTRGAFMQLIAVPTLVTFVLAGLWHGAGGQFLMFGLLHGVFLVTCQCVRLYRPLIWKDTASYERVMAPVGLVLTFCCTAMALTFFRAESTAAAASLVAGMVGLHGVELPPGVATHLPALAAPLRTLGVQFTLANVPRALAMWSWIAALLGIAMLVPNLLFVLREYQPSLTPAKPTPLDPSRVLARLAALPTWRPDMRWALLTGLAIAISFLTLGDVTDFLYWQF